MAIAGLILGFIAVAVLIFTWPSWSLPFVATGLFLSGRAFHLHWEQRQDLIIPIAGIAMNTVPLLNMMWPSIDHIIPHY